MCTVNLDRIDRRRRRIAWAAMIGSALLARAAAGSPAGELDASFGHYGLSDTKGS